ncbi:CinA family nicotinamide mononucleotide deamidase-related protein [Alkalibacterium kapii]|uniref:Putative competence-damage inducible protein n=1 Tax=Alkalibacterium kapii TaxID=426704 RepID=A0A511AS98_9LACT|nr:CinA family nicotinamide mononucleotide deamidase-related protein [Alkalibacterium kapii]GEK91074.1 putative competence-damage inducible protein [Alkalibacterium kapii]
MKTEIISIGTELLMGYVTDTNAPEIAQELLDIGVGIYYQQTVGDNPDRLRAALELAAKRSDLIIMTGGLGPTQDDITKQVAAEFLGDELITDKKQLNIMEDFFEKRGEEPDENVYREALTFKNGQTFHNHVGLACGSAYKWEQPQQTSKHFILLPGVPHEMTAMLKGEVKPYLKKMMREKGVIESLFMNFNGIGESKVATLLNEHIENQTNPTIAMYAKPRHITIRLTANAATTEKAKAMNEKVAADILTVLSKNFIGYGKKQTIETHVVELLQKKESTLSVSEGFTSGLVMSNLTSISGVSSIFEGGLVATTNEMKEKQFRLSDLDNKSEEVKGRMLAERIRVDFETDIGLSIDAETTWDDSKQLMCGTGYISVAVKDKETQSKTYPLSKRPQAILKETLKNEALAFLKEVLE